MRMKGEREGEGGSKYLSQGERCSSTDRGLQQFQSGFRWQLENQLQHHTTQGKTEKRKNFSHLKKLSHAFRILAYKRSGYRI